LQPAQQRPVFPQVKVERGNEHLGPWHLDRGAGLRLLRGDVDPPHIAAPDDGALECKAGEVAQAQRPSREQGNDQTGWRWPSRSISALSTCCPAVVGDLRENGCHADVQIAIGPTRLVARITRHSAARLALAPNKPVFAVIESVAIDGRGLALLSPDENSIHRALGDR
jgi:hypothetical protein